MSDEPRKPVEELLQASAKTRRAEFGSDPKMPNPMRAQLHDEIRRMAREDEPKSRRSWNWFAISWPVGTVATAVLVVAFVMSRSHEFQSPSETRQVATNQRDRAHGILRPATPEVAAAAVARADDEKSDASKKFADVASEAKPEGPAAAAPQPGNPLSSSTSFAQTPKKTQSGINQQFSRNAPRAAARASKLKEAVNVLNTFQIQQSGDQIRVVDADGSTYTGKIESGVQDAIGRNSKDEGRAFAPRTEQDLSQQNSSQFYFRASGYNNSLKKAVVFEGNYTTAPAQTKSPNEQAAANQQQLPARVIGTAKVSGESPIEVDATSLPQ